jgi:hypothetical protein
VLGCTVGYRFRLQDWIWLSGRDLLAHIASRRRIERERESRLDSFISSAPTRHEQDCRALIWLGRGKDGGRGVRASNPWFVVRPFEAEIWVEARGLFKVVDMYSHGSWCTVLACLR